MKLIHLLLFALLVIVTYTFLSPDRWAPDAPEPEYLVITITTPEQNCVYHISRETAKKVARLKTLTIELCDHDPATSHKIQVK